MGGVSIKNLTRRRLTASRAVFSKIANEMLPGWDISLVFVGPKQARELNEKLRGKIYVPNVLSYAVGDQSGEIFICLSEAARQASNFNLEPLTFNLFLFIHGLLHLKGWAHSAKMEKCERKLLVKFAHTNVATNSHRH